MIWRPFGRSIDVKMGRYCVSLNCKHVQKYISFYYSLCFCIFSNENTMRTQQTNKQSEQQYSCVLCWFFRILSPHRVWPIVEHKSIQCLQQTKHLCRMYLMCFICSMWLMLCENAFICDWNRSWMIFILSNQSIAFCKWSTTIIDQIHFIFYTPSICILHSWHSIIFNILEFSFFIYHFNHSSNRHH